MQVSLGKLLFHRGLSEFLNIETEFLNMENIFTIQRSYETPRQGRTSPAGTHRQGLGTDAAVGGGGDCYTHVMLLLWGADAASF